MPRSRPPGLKEYWRQKHAAKRHLSRKPRTAQAVATMKARFLLLYAQTGLVNKTCEALVFPDGGHVTRAHIQRWIASDAGFAQRYTDARVSFGESLEQEAHRRAVIGIEKPVYYRGEEVGTVTEFSDQLLVTLLKANLPDKYRERVDLNVDIAAEIKRAAEEFGVPVEMVEAEYREMRPRLLAGGKS